MHDFSHCHITAAIRHAIKHPRSSPLSPGTQPASNSEADRILTLCAYLNSRTAALADQVHLPVIMAATATTRTRIRRHRPKNASICAGMTPEKC